jgi:FKBP-type peptidyl-prolyl cis-trans isomerase 2
VKEEAMSQAREGDTVDVHYTGRLTDGTVFETSTQSEPLRFELGNNDLLPAIQQTVIGMEVGESRTIRIPSAEAYGPRRDDMLMAVDRNRLADGFVPVPGMVLEVHRGDGEAIPVVVTSVADDEITLDGNHPLAGHDLDSDISLVGIL